MGLFEHLKSRTMKESLTNALEALKEARVTIKRPTGRRRAALFGEDEYDGLEFNGFRNALQFRSFLFSNYARCKLALDIQVNTRALESPTELLRELHMVYYDLKEFRRQFFPKGHESLALQRVVLEKTPMLGKEDAALKAALRVFLAEQSHSLLSLKKLFKHRIRHLEHYYGKVLPGAESRPRLRPSRSQLVLFPDDQDTTLLRWDGAKVEFAEVFEALLESGTVGLLGEGRPSREDFFGLMQWVFNYKVENIGPIIRSARKRKIENAPFLLKLVDVFKGTTSPDL